MNIPSQSELGQLYLNAALKFIPLDLQGWHADEPIFRELVQLLAPTTYIEVGSWKGASLDRVIRECRVAELPVPTCYCVDFWQETGLFDQFLTNVRAIGAPDRVIPLKGHSADAARALKAAGVKAQLIYIDAGHTFTDCARDMDDYWDLLAPGGIMFGDDYTEEKGVALAVKTFSHARGINFSHTYYHWKLEPKK